MMSIVIENRPLTRPGASWLRNYYFIRAVVSAGWVGAAFSLHDSGSAAAAGLLIAYPVWDAAANLLDGARSGGLAQNRTQAFNAVVSGLVAVAFAVSIGNLHTVLALFGAWAIGAGLLQLATGARRWKTAGAQWAMILSGAQSALAGGFFIKQSLSATAPVLATVAPYAAFGAFYFLISALWLTFRPGASRGAATA